MTKSIRTITAALTLVLATLVGSTAFAAPVDVNHDALELGTSLDDDGRFDAAVTLDGVININTASADQLEMLPGIGPAIANKIVNYREDHPFQQRNNIMRIKGIGKKTFNKMKDFLVIEGETTLKVAG